MQLVHARFVNSVHAVVSNDSPAEHVLHNVQPRFELAVQAVDSYCPVTHVAQPVQTRFVSDVHAVDSYVLPVHGRVHAEHTRFVSDVHAVVS